MDGNSDIRAEDTTKSDAENRSVLEGKRARPVRAHIKITLPERLDDLGRQETQRQNNVEN